MTLKVIENESTLSQMSLACEPPPGMVSTVNRPRYLGHLATLVKLFTADSKGTLRVRGELQLSND